jgi:hypothetical protein
MATRVCIQPMTELEITTKFLSQIGIPYQTDNPEHVGATRIRAEFSDQHYVVFYFDKYEALQDTDVI